jgi:hypothetical protein
MDDKAAALKECTELADYLVGPTTQPDRESPFYVWWKAQIPKPASGVYVFSQLEDAFNAGMICGMYKHEEMRLHELDSQHQEEGGRDA